MKPHDTEPDLDNLEMQLRALGRRLEQQPDQELIDRARAGAAVALRVQGATYSARYSRRMFMGVVGVLFATLPIPALFLWADWATASRLFEWLLPTSAISYVSYAYLWIKVCALAVIYGMGIPALLWATARALQTSHGQFIPAEGARLT